MGFLTVLNPVHKSLAAGIPSGTITGSATNTNPSGGTLSLTIPAGTKLGNKMLIGIGSYSSGVSTPAGWVKDSTETASGLTLYLFTRTATAGDLGGSTTVSFTGGSISMKGVFMSVQSTSGTLNITTLAQGGTTTSNSFTISSITTTVDGCLIFELVTGMVLASGNISLTAPATIQIQTSIAADGYIAFCTQPQAMHGATGTNAATFSNTGTANDGFAYLKNALQP